MKQYIKSVIVLTSICLVVALMLAVTNHFTKDKIAQNNAQAAYAACFEVMPEAKAFEEVDLSTYQNLPASLTNAYKETNGLGYTYKHVVTGKNPGLTVMVGIDNTGLITGATVVASQETPSYFGGDKATSYASKFAGKDSTLAGIELISGATMSSKAFKDAVSDAFNANAVIAGMEVTKSKEMLIAEVLKETLSVKEITVENVTVENVTAIYSSDQFDGYAVEVTINDIKYYIGYSYSGNVLGLAAASTDELSEGFTLDKEATNDVETALLKVVEDMKAHKDAIANYILGEAFAKVLGKDSATLTAYANSFELPTIQKALEYYPDHEEELSTKNLSASVTAIFEAEEGYVFFVKAQGHNGAIVLMVSVNKEGAIIDTLAIQQKETPDYAEDVFTDKYEDQYHGLTSLPEDKEITYSYATVSSTTYSISVRCALKASSLIDGGNN